MFRKIIVHIHPLLLVSTMPKDFEYKCDKNVALWFQNSFNSLYYIILTVMSSFLFIYLYTQQLFFSLTMCVTHCMYILRILFVSFFRCSIVFNQNKHIFHAIDKISFIIYQKCFFIMINYRNCFLFTYNMIVIYRVDK